MNKTIGYLNNKKWSDITRDERTFCMYLFNVFENCPEKLNQAIRESNWFALYGKNQSFNVEEKEWEIGVEVCFYRDLLYDYGIRVKGDANKLVEFGIKDPSKLIKRTFDLCLFSENEIVIIEAKSAESLTTKQFEDFLMDKEYIEKIFKGLMVRPPKIKMVILASSKYFNSSSFTSPNGVAKLNIIDKDYIDGLISWNELAVFSRQNKIGSESQIKMLKRADAPNE